MIPKPPCMPSWQDLRKSQTRKKRRESRLTETRLRKTAGLHPLTPSSMPWAEVGVEGRGEEGGEGQKRGELDESELVVGQPERDSRDGVRVARRRVFSDDTLSDEESGDWDELHREQASASPVLSEVWGSAMEAMTTRRRVVYTHLHVHTQKHTNTHMFSPSHTCIQGSSTHTHTHTNTHTHTHTPQQHRGGGGGGSVGTRRVSSKICAPQFVGGSAGTDSKNLIIVRLYCTCTRTLTCENECHALQRENGEKAVPLRASHLPGLGRMPEVSCQPLMLPSFTPSLVTHAHIHTHDHMNT